MRQFVTADTFRFEKVQFPYHSLKHAIHVEANRCRLTADSRIEASINSDSKRPDHDDEEGRHQALQPAYREGRLRHRYTIAHGALTKRTATSAVQEIGDHDVRLCLSSGTQATRRTEHGLTTNKI